MGSGGYAMRWERSGWNALSVVTVLMDVYAEVVDIAHGGSCYHLELTNGLRVKNSNRHWLMTPSVLDSASKYLEI